MILVSLIKNKNTIMSKMYIMVGLPGSGKTTKCEQILMEDGNAVRLNKDLTRKMLHFGKFSGRREGQTREAVRELAILFLKTSNVVIDDTNLNPRTMQGWKDLAKEENAKVEVIDMTDVPVEECVRRDAERQDSVGGTVIKNMALRYGLKQFNPDSVVICDIDGTISDTTHRLHYVNVPEGQKKDWKGFFSEIENDPVREDVLRMLIEYYNEGKTIIFMSGRPEQYKEATLRWLAKYSLTFAYTLIMRRDGDKRPDTETKKELFEQHFPDKSVIHVVLDDRPSIVKLWRDMELNVIDVGKGISF